MTCPYLHSNSSANAPRSGAVVVVGAGHAGENLVSMLRQGKFTGDIVLIGAEPHPPYHRPPLSKKFLSDEYEQLLRPTEFYERQGIQLRLDTEVVRIDGARKKIHTATGEAIEYGMLVIATGAAARRLSVPGADLTGVLSLRTLDDAKALRAAMTSVRRLAIVGGGYIGLEVAAQAASHGDLEIVVIEREERLLARVASPEFSAALHAAHRTRGIEIRTGTDVAAFESDSSGHVRTVVLSDGEHLVCDAALVGVGAVPRDELARSAGIDCDGGILVDGAARTSDPSILAIGDVTRRPFPGQQERLRMESIPSAVEQARQAVATIAGQLPPEPEVAWFWSDQFDLKLKIAGLVRPCRPAITRGDPATGKFAVFHLDAEDRVTAVETSNAAASFMAAKKMIANQHRVNPDLLADNAIDLRSCIAAHQSAFDVTPNRA